MIEIKTLKSIREPQDVWRRRWTDKPDGLRIVINILSQFNPITQVETGLFRYELWEENTISQTEVEDYHVRHYEPAKIEKLLEEHNLKIIGKWQAEPHTWIKANDTDAIILYECIKN